MVTGSVATDELVENAVTCASRIPDRNLLNDNPANARATNGYTMKIMIPSPITTTKEYQPRNARISANFSGSDPAALTICPAIKANTKTGMAFITTQTIWMKISLRPSTNLATGSLLSLGISTITIPKKIAKKMTCSMDMSTKDLNILEGTTSTSGCNGPELFWLALLFILSSTHSFTGSPDLALTRSTIFALASSQERHISSRSMTFGFASFHNSYSMRFSILIASSTISPGLRRFTSTNPSEMANKVVIR